MERLRAYIHNLKAEQHNRDLAELRLVHCNHGTGIEYELNDTTLDVVAAHRCSQEGPAIPSQIQGVRSVEVELRDGQDGVESRRFCFDMF